jgi:hypothetical protein
MLVNHTPPYKLQVLSLSAFELGSSSRQVRNLYGVLLVDHLSHDAQAACHPCGLPWFNTAGNIVNSSWDSQGRGQR